MAGLYIHVPFCSKKCLYCDFYSIRNSKNITDFHILIEKELLLRKEFLKDATIETIYLGGGTPSLLQYDSLFHILNAISKNLNISKYPEITIEVNPDDLNKNILNCYAALGINRISIGIQSFIDKELFFLGRRHDCITAERAICLAQDFGFKNISIDLIYGLPNSTLSHWEYNLKKAFSLQIQHLSCYHLTYEMGTVLFRKLKEKKIEAVDESLSLQEFNLMRELANQKGFIHYEISNLAKEGFFSKHNSSYWQGLSYLGLGPAAHSYNGSRREWNPSSFSEWEFALNSSKPAPQFEEINQQTKFNEILITRLRTIWGVNLSSLKDEFDKALIDNFYSNAKNHLEKSLLVIMNDHLLINPQNWFISDSIIEDLLIVD